MQFPVTPQDVQAIIPSASASWCAKLLQFPLRLGYLALKALTFMVTPTGDPTDDFKTWLNLDPGATPVVGLPVVTASNGTATDKVAVTWTPVAGAASYNVYRSATPDSAAAVLIGSLNGLAFDDLVAPPGMVAGTTYTYFVRALVNGVLGAFSLGDTGFASTGGGGSGTLIKEGQQNGEFTVITAGEYRMEAWGGGGGSSYGGGATSGFGGATLVPDLMWGAAGGAGGYVMVVVPLLAGDVIVAAIGPGGAGGPGSFEGGSNINHVSGQPGGQTLIRRRRAGVDAMMAQAEGGGGGIIGWSEYSGFGTPSQGGAGGSGTYTDEATGTDVESGNPGAPGRLYVQETPLPPPPAGGVTRGPTLTGSGAGSGNGANGPPTRGGGQAGNRGYWRLSHA